MEERKRRSKKTQLTPRILPSKSIPKSWLNKAIDRNGNEKEFKPFQPNQKGKRNQPKLFSPKWSKTQYGKPYKFNKIRSIPWAKSFYFSRKAKKREGLKVIKGGNTLDSLRLTSLLPAMTLFLFLFLSLGLSQHSKTDWTEA